MTQKVYGLTRDNGDGSGSIIWFRDKEVVDRILDEDSELEGWVQEAFYANEGSPAVELTFPDDLDLNSVGFRFRDDDEQYSVE